jgi:hypothetical protein
VFETPAVNYSSKDNMLNLDTPKVPFDADILLREAHRVLVHHLPDVSPPQELSRVRAVLDAHMFGRDRRASRDAIVEIARQIDRLLAMGMDRQGDASERRVRRR